MRQPRPRLMCRCLAHAFDTALRNASALSERWLAAPPIAMRSLVRDIIDQVIVGADRIDVRLSRAKIAAAFQVRVQSNTDLDRIVLSVVAELYATRTAAPNSVSKREPFMRD